MMTSTSTIRASISFLVGILLVVGIVGVNGGSIILKDSTPGQNQLDNPDDDLHDTHIVDKILVIENRLTSDSSPTYQVRFKAFDQQIDLQLQRPANTIFTEGFTFATSNVKSGDLKDIEDTIFVDPSTRSAVTLIGNSGNGGFHEINGFVNGFGIRHAQNGLHHVTRRKDGFGPAKYSKKNFCGVKKLNSATIPNHPQSTHDEPSTKAEQESSPVVEVRAVLDQTLARQLGSQQNVTKYVATMFHAVNVVFSDFYEYYDPLQARLASIFVLSQADDNAIVQSAQNNIGQILENYSNWLYNRPYGLGPGDVAPLIMGVKSLTQDGQQSALGLAYGATTGSNICTIQGPSVSQDFGAFWDGTLTVAHEIGHGLGLSHDFDEVCGGEEADQGYIMGYKGGNANKFRFSECSRRQLRDNIPNAPCLFTRDAGSEVRLGTESPGDVPGMTFDFQCYKFIKSTFRDETDNIRYEVNENPAEEACTRLRCTFSDQYSQYRTEDANYPPAEGTSCNLSGGRCRQGACV